MWKIFRTKKDKRIKDLEFDNEMLQLRIDSLEMPPEEETPKPSIADVMRDALGSLVIDFTKTADYLDDEKISQDERINRITQGEELWKNPMFHILCDHIMNEQGNFILRRAVSDSEIFTGRMTINGISLFKKEVERCHMLFQDMVQSKSDFNPYEVH